MLWSHVYGEEIDKFDPHVEKLLKYFIRQFNLVLALNTEDFMQVKFTWAPFEDVREEMYWNDEFGDYDGEGDRESADGVEDGDEQEAEEREAERDEFDDLMDEADIAKGHYDENGSSEKSYYEKLYGIK